MYLLVTDNTLTGEKIKPTLKSFPKSVLFSKVLNVDILSRHGLAESIFWTAVHELLSLCETKLNLSV